MKRLKTITNIKFSILLLSIFSSTTVLHAQNDSLNPGTSSLNNPTDKPSPVINALNEDIERAKKYPTVGQPCPDFTLTNIKFYSRKKATLKDFRGKWLVLDFWSKYCGACVSSFPYTNKLLKEMGDKVEVMLVGIQDPENEIQRMYAKYRERENLTMPCSFDSALSNRFELGAVPYVVLIDDKGIVRCITYSISSDDLRGFMAGTPPALPKAYRGNEDVEDPKVSFDEKKALLEDGNGAGVEDLLFRSVLSSWRRGIHHAYVPSSIEQGLQEGRFQVLGTPLLSLYNYAFYGVSKWDANDTSRYGKFYNTTILDIEDSSIFKFSYKYARNLFSYSVSVPRNGATRERVKEAMQNDLQNYFGFNAGVETRKCPYFRLVASDKVREKLKTKGGKPTFEGITRASFTVTNYPFENLLALARSNSTDFIVDETGITGNIDITMDCVQTDPIDVRKALIANGFELIPAEKEMQVLVIRDKGKKGDPTAKNTYFIVK